MTKTRIKQISFLLALVMLFGIMSLTIIAQPDDTLYSANWANGSVWLYPSVNGTATITHTSQFPSKLIVTKASDGWYYITNTDWPAEFDDRRYVPERYLTNISPLQNTATAQIGAFTVSVDGAIPSNVSLKASVISEENVDPGIFERQDVNMVKFLACYDLSLSQNGTEWQPTKDNPVTVTMNAAALGLYTGQEVYVIHMHENADGTKKYEILSPTYVLNGKFSFKTDSFSEYAIFQGNGAVAIDNGRTQEDPDIIWAEPGANIMVVVRPDAAETDVTSVNPNSEVVGTKPDSITIEGVSMDAAGWENCTGNVKTTALIKISADAAINDQVLIKCTSENSTKVNTYLLVKVGTRADVTRVALENYPLEIAIRKPDANGSFPSEPTSTDYNNTYYFFLNNGSDDTNQTNDTIVDDRATYSRPANIFLNPEVMGNTFGWMYDAQGVAIGGVIDATGYYTKACFVENTIVWNDIANVIAQNNDTQISNNGDSSVEQLVSSGALVSVQYKQEVPVSEDTDGTQDGFMTFAIVLTADDSKTLASYTGGVENYAQVYYGEFELIPYVIKLVAGTETGGWAGNSTSESVWHVDIALVRGDAYTLSYELNLGANIVSSTAIVLPTAQVLVEDPTDLDTSLVYIFTANDTLKNAEGNAIASIKVKSIAETSSGQEVDAYFKGWYTQNTCADSDNDTYGYGMPDPRNTIELSSSTKLYAIWEIEAGALELTRTSFSVTKQVHLEAGSPAGSHKPLVNETDFHAFDFTVTIPYVYSLTGDERKVEINTDLGEMYFVASKYVDGVMTEIPTVTSSVDEYVTLAELCSGSTLSFIKNVDQQSDRVVLTFELADGEYVSFLNVPYFSVDTEAQYNYYLVTEAAIPTELQDKYTAVTFEQTLKLNEMTDARATFINYYTPPVAGLQISAQTGEPGEWIICEVTANYAGFKPLQLAVQVGGSSVTVVGLLCGEEYVYTVTELNTNTAVENIVLEEGQVSTAALTTTRKPKWFFGFGMIKQTANGQN